MRVSASMRTTRTCLLVLCVCERARASRNERSVNGAASPLCVNGPAFAAHALCTCMHCVRACSVYVLAINHM